MNADLPPWFPQALLPKAPALSEMSAEDFDALPTGGHLFTFTNPEGKIGFIDVNIVTRSHTRYPHAQMDFKSYWSVNNRLVYPIRARRGHLGEEMVKATQKIKSPGFLTKFT